ncbi:MAG: CAP domain-containing protein [Candidatus Limnocylindria bacterium]
MARIVPCALAVALALVAVLPARPSAAATLDAVESELLGLINELRAARGLAELKVSGALVASSQWLSADMAANDYFSHTSLDGRSPQQRMADAGYPAFATSTGEDLAAGQLSAREVLQSWIDSPAHLAVLLDPGFRAAGIGRAYQEASTYRWYWTADLGGALDADAGAEVGYHASWVGQTADPTLAPSQTATLVLALRNTGYRGWYAGVPGRQASLGTAAPLDAPRPELALDWLSPSRIATTTTSYVGPGQIGWFEVRVRAPAAPGAYRLDARGVIDGVTWLEDLGIHWTITVR